MTDRYVGELGKISREGRVQRTLARTRFKRPNLRTGSACVAWAKQALRDWWAGRKFAQYAQATGRTTTLIQEREVALAGNRQSLAAQLGLAYLYEGRGDAAKAQALWAQIIRPGIVY